jgi:hypothetical protein
MRKVWSPADGAPTAPEQIPPTAREVHGDGSTDRDRGGLWAPSEGPVRVDPGGPGGEPSGHARPPLPSELDDR